jgi:histidinol-phosphate aminotransferase
LLRGLPERVVAVVDEAYVEYVEADDFAPATELRDTHERLAILRTFSKAYGLAALRVGYVIGTPELVHELNRLRAPFNVGTAGQVAALAALEDAAHLRTVVDATVRDRRLLASALRESGIAVAPSQANFLLVDVGRPARPVYEALLRVGVIVRPMAPPLDTWLRVTVGLPEENQRFLESLRRALGAC